MHCGNARSRSSMRWRVRHQLPYRERARPRRDRRRRLHPAAIEETVTGSLRPLGGSRVTRDPPRQSIDIGVGHRPDVPPAMLIRRQRHRLPSVEVDTEIRGLPPGRDGHTLRSHDVSQRPRERPHHVTAGGRQRQDQVGIRHHHPATLGGEGLCPVGRLRSRERAEQLAHPRRCSPRRTIETNPPTKTNGDDEPDETRTEKGTQHEIAHPRTSNEGDDRDEGGERETHSIVHKP